jgi:hypothetical protein
LRASVLAVVFLFACTPTNSGANDAALYVAELEPLVRENGLVADAMLHLAADVHDGRADGSLARERWDRDIVPLADHLRDQAAAVQPPAAWAQHHKDLVDIWTYRADAYHDASEAVTLADAERWKLARQRADAAKLREETWFQEVNKRLADYDMAVDQFP